MQVALDILRGLGVYIFIIAGFGAGMWLFISPIIQDHGRCLTAVGGAGAILVLVVIVGLGVATTGR